MRYQATALISALILLSGSAVAQAQHHPFSELYPPDNDLDIGGQDLLGVSEVEAADIKANATSQNLTFKDSGGTEILVWDLNNDKWVFKNSDTVLNGNVIQSLDPPCYTFDSTGSAWGGIKFQDSGSDEFHLFHDTNGDKLVVEDWTGGGASYTEWHGGGPIKFYNPVDGDEVLRMNASGSDNIEIPNGDLKIANGNALRWKDSTGGASTVLWVDGNNDTRLESAGLNGDLILRGRDHQQKLVLPDNDGGLEFTDWGGDKLLDIESNGPIRLRDDSQTVLEAKDGGNVEIPNGNLNMSSNDIKNVGNSDVDMEYDNSDSRMEMTSNGNTDICIGNC